jgi:tellurite resistance protein TehA-like permease
MATGIVSIATGLVGLGWVSRGLFAVNLAAFPALCVWLALLVYRDPTAIVAEFRERPTPGVLTTVAATCVVGNELALAGAGPELIDGLCALAVILWVSLTYGFVMLKTTHTAKPPAETALDGSWLLLVVATEALAIMATRAGAGGPTAAGLVAALCLFLLGGAMYAVLIGLIVNRWLFLHLSPERLTAPYWINMGAAAIATLAGCRLLTAMDEAAAPIAAARDAVFAVTVLFWALATWWIPLLAMLTWWRHRNGVRLIYRLENWSMVFPLGMYTAATWRFAHVLRVPALELIPQAFVWVALAVWCLTFAGMLRSLARGS